MSSIPKCARIACGAALWLGIVGCTNDYDGLLPASVPGSSAGSGGAPGAGGASSATGGGPGVGAAGTGGGGAGVTGGAASTATTGGAGGAPPCVPGDTYLLADDFEDGAYAAAWNEYESGSASAQENGGQLRVELDQTFGYGNWAGVRGGLSNLRGCSIMVHAEEIPSAEALAYLGFNTQDGADGVAIAANEAAIYFCITSSFIATCAPQNHQATGDDWWRLREQGNQLFFETSADGTAWNVRDQTAAPAWIDAGEPEIGAGTQGNLDGAREARLDDFNRPP